MTVDQDFDALRMSPRVRAAAMSIGAAGFLCLLLALQTNSMLRGGGLYWMTVPVMLLLGVAMVLCAVQLSRMRGWASQVGMSVAGVAALLSLVWLVFIVMNSIFSFMAVLVIPATVTASLLVRGTRQATKAADAARARLETAGLDAGF